MKEKILKVTTAIALIITLTMANVLVLCDGIVSYAANAISETKSTSHKNVEFMAYFKDSNGNKVSSLDEKTNSEDMKMYLQVSVKQNGYFNGQISLKNSNFKFKTDIQNDIVNKIDENNIYLNQINAGDTKEIEVGIEFVKDSEFDLSLISIESKLGLSGIYRDETEKNISITATRTVRLHMVSPYQKGDNILSQEVITNKILNYNGVDKKVVQIKVTSGIKDNLFPIKATSLEIVAPKILDKFPKTVLVSSVDNLTTNNKKLSDDMWNYNTETGTMNITINNENVENKVSWLREGNDTFIITYIFDETGRFEEQSNKISSKIELYDDNKTVFTASHEMGLSNEEKDSIFKIEQVQNETSIYKGKLYYGIDREFTYKTILNTNLLGVASSVNILDKDSNSTIKSIYKTTKINKQKMIDILGENGRITIVNADTNKQLAIIDAQTEVNENGDIIVEYKENVENDVDHEGQILSKKMPYYFIDNFLMKYHEKTFTFPFWSTRYNSIYSILNALSTGHPVLVRVHKTIYSSGDAENLLSRVLETSVDGFDFYTKYHRENLEHYIVLVGLQGENVITIDSSVDGFINYCPLKTLLYSLVPGLLHTVFNNDHFRFYYAWDLNLLL